MRILLIALVFNCVGFTAHAEETSSKTEVKIEKVSNPKIGDLDKEVSDIKLRANSGSKRRYSSSLSFTYAGAAVRDPGKDARPNVGDSRTPESVSLAGTFGFRYRLNKNESLFLATGLYRERPFHERQGEQLEVFDPNFGYNRTFATYNDLQISTGVRAYMTTLDAMRKFGYVGTAAYYINSINPIGTSRFSGGVSLIASASAFDKPEDERHPYNPFKKLGDAQKDYGVSFTPSLQYNKTGRVNAYTSLTLVNYSHYRTSEAFEFEKEVMTQTLGLGIAVVRDFYLSPYLQFEPEQFNVNKTSANLTATINL